ncbi:MAG: hypothetical protein J6A95_05160 [Clostridia bacterium]|nr:hypothetical protein [Clostridia bacterium]
MKKQYLHSYTIMPLDVTHLEEISQDIKEQYKDGVCSCALFKMTLVPEGNPPSDKVGILCEQYAKFKERLDKMEIPNGVLVQASVGHGWVLGEMFPYQTHVNFTDGKSTRVVCPCDEGFKDYIYNVMATIARYEPNHIMIDDDFRTIWYKGEGCACPLHMERFNKKAGTSLSDRELWKIVNTKSELAKKYTDIFIEEQKLSLVETAKVMRAGVDSINPAMPMSYCCCGNNAEFAYEIASVLAGKGNPIVVRINNGNYTPGGARYFSRAFHRAATQIAKLKGKVDVFLAETDTCPQNRYSTGAMSLHTHFTGSILEGTNGAKHWITRLISYEPESGRAYRKVLGKHSGFYEKLAEIQPTLKWYGCRIFVPATPDFTYGRVKEEWDGWSYCVLERLGIPMYFSSENGGVVCLEGDVDSRLSDNEILEILKGKVMLASDTAQNLIKRGFGKYLGVNVRKWQGKIPVNELILKTNCRVAMQQKAMEIVPLNDAVKISSYVSNTTDYEHYENLFPGSTIYKNELGGTAFVFCGTPVAEFHISTAFSFLNYSRKQQLIEMINMAGELPIYYPNDEEIYLKAADMENGDLFCAVFNIGLDGIDTLELICDFKATKFKKLMPNGEINEIDFELKNNRYILNTPCNILEPVVLFIERNNYKSSF